MTGHRVTVDDDGFHGIHVTCIDCDDLDQHGIGTREWANLIATNHRLETLADGYGAKLRRMFADAERTSRRFPPSGGHYAAGYTAGLRAALIEWAGDEAMAALVETLARVEACGSHEEKVEALRSMSRDAQRRLVLRAIPGGAAS